MHTDTARHQVVVITPDLEQSILTEKPQFKGANGRSPALSSRSGNQGTKWFKFVSKWQPMSANFSNQKTDENERGGKSRHCPGNDRPGVDIEDSQHQS